jgi:hypothetical protein
MFDYMHSVSCLDRSKVVETVSSLQQSDHDEKIQNEESELQRPKFEVLIFLIFI